MKFFIVAMLLSGVGVLVGCGGPQTVGKSARGAPSRAEQRPKSGLDVYIEGMACPFCTYNVEKKIREIPDVKSVTTDLRTGIAHVEFEEDAEPDLKRIWRKVQKSGFTPNRIVTPREVYHGP